MKESRLPMKKPDEMTPKELDGAWEQQLALRADLVRAYDGDFGAYALSRPNLHEAFYRDGKGHLDLVDRGVKCIDEGTPGGVRIAGAGILEGVEKTVAMLASLDVDVIHSHSGCGAAAKYARDNSITDVDPDVLAQQFAAKVAHRRGIQHHHIRREQLRRNPHMHPATVVYYSGVKAFDASQVPDGLPLGFVITRALRHSPQPAIAEADFVCQIAFSHHGFGDRFTRQNPLMIVPIGNPHKPQLGLHALTTELQPLAHAYGDRVIINGFESPF